MKVGHANTEIIEKVNSNQDKRYAVNIKWYIICYGRVESDGNTRIAVLGVLAHCWQCFFSLYFSSWSLKNINDGGKKHGRSGH